MRVGGLAILAILLAALGAVCQAVGAQARQARARSSPYLITRWTTEQGLPQNSVTAIVQTPDGYLWLGTQRGLARCQADNGDGSVKHYRQADGLVNDDVKFVMEDRAGAL